MHPHTCRKYFYSGSYIHKDMLTHISRAGVLWLRVEQLEWRLQWWWWAVTIWRSACLPASSACGMNHLPTTGCQWINMFLRVTWSSHIRVCMCYIQYLAHWCFPRLCGLPAVTSRIRHCFLSGVDSPALGSEELWSSFDAPSHLITRTICLRADGCTCAANAVEMQGIRGVEEIFRNVDSVYWPCQTLFHAVGGGCVSSCPLCLDI